MIELLQAAMTISNKCKKTRDCEDCPLYVKTGDKKVCAVAPDMMAVPLDWCIDEIMEQRYG